MAYKRYFYRNGKKFGPYYYESYRDKSGKVKKRYIGTVNPLKEKQEEILTPVKTNYSYKKYFVFGISIFVLLLVLLMVNYSLSNNFSVSDTVKIISVLKDKAISPVSKLVGLTIDETIQNEVENVDESAAQEIPMEDGEEDAEEYLEEVVQEVPAEIGQEETTLGEEENLTEEAGQENETEEEDFTDSNESEIILNETEENDAVINETSPTIGFNETNFTDDNSSINENNFSSINESILNFTDENITIVNETEQNLTEINATEINETITSELNITRIQYKAIIGKPVKWVATVTINKTYAEEENIDLVIELPKDAQNISVKTGQEAKGAYEDARESEEETQKKERKSFLTGEVIVEDDNNGILIKVWEFLTGFSITGNVIEGEELDNQITQKEDKTEVNLEQVVEEEADEEQEIAIEYETPAPQAEEETISRGKQVVVTADDELNYTDILAYTQLDNRVSINETEKIKVYWIKQETVELEVEGIAEEANETIEETEELVEEKTEEETIENETAGNETLVEINETLSLLTGQAISEEEDKEEELISSTNGTQKEITEINETIITEEENSEEIQVQETQISLIRQEVNFTAYDLDLDGKIDYIEWNVEHLSNQTYEIIYITKAEHYDSNFTFIEDVYDSVKELDGNYTTIQENHTLRVTFEQALDNSKDITIFARAECNGSVFINGTEVPCEIYEKKKRIDEIRGMLEE